jgi:hypothetical protein
LGSLQKKVKALLVRSVLVLVLEEWCLVEVVLWQVDVSWAWLLDLRGWK